MEAKTNVSKKDIAVAIGCIVFLVMNIGAIGSGGRAKARDTLCRSNLRQWGVMFQMYAEDNEGQFGDGAWGGYQRYWRLIPPNLGANRGYREWMAYLRPYYDNDYRLTTCPMATKPWSEGGRGKNSAWGIFPGRSSWGGVIQDWDEHRAGYAQAVAEGAWQPECAGDRGSYGMNNWCVGMPENRGLLMQTPPRLATYRPLAGGWLTLNVKNANTIPLLMDAIWLAGSPSPGDIPSPIELGVTQAAGSANNMNRFCVNRHNGNVNSLFMDFSVRPVGLKELWILQWSRTYVIDDPIGGTGAIQTIQALGAWPPWMAEFKDYFDISP